MQLNNFDRLSISSIVSIVSYMHSISSFIYWQGCFNRFNHSKYKYLSMFLFSADFMSEIWRNVSVMSLIYLELLSLMMISLEIRNIIVS